VAAIRGADCNRDNTVTINRRDLFSLKSVAAGEESQRNAAPAGYLPGPAAP